MVRGLVNIAVFNRALMRLCRRFLINLPRQQPPRCFLQQRPQWLLMFCIYSVVFQSISARPYHLFIDKGSWLVNILRPAENTVRSKRSRWMSWISEMKRAAQRLSIRWKKEKHQEHEQANKRPPALYPDHFTGAIITMQPGCNYKWPSRSSHTNFRCYRTSRLLKVDPLQLSQRAFCP